MGMSGMKGQVYYVDDQCPDSDCDGWDAPTTDSATCLQDEVIRFVIEDSVYKREYGHDKSFGWQDVCAGIRRFGITLEAMWRNKAGGSAVDEILYAGRVLYLLLYPLGVDGSTCATPLAGYALIDRVTKTHDQERGEPISYSCTLSSKGPWTGPSTGVNWGGFECECSSSGA
jgi:hypothetical protein